MENRGVEQTLRVGMRERGVGAVREPPRQKAHYVHVLLCKKRTSHRLLLRCEVRFWSLYPAREPGKLRPYGPNLTSDRLSLTPEVRFGKGLRF